MQEPSEAESTKKAPQIRSGLPLPPQSSIVWPRASRRGVKYAQQQLETPQERKQGLLKRVRRGIFLAALMFSKVEGAVSGFF